jgi:molybdopterin molybdotransferase
MSTAPPRNPGISIDRTSRVFSALSPVPQALAALAGGLAPVAATEVAIADALGLVLARSLVAATDHPPHETARSEGFAVAAALTAGASPYAPVSPPGSAVWVEAGDPIPSGCDAVLAPDGLDETSSPPAIVTEAVRRQGVRSRGEEIAAGAVVAREGVRLTAAHLAAARLMGDTKITVRAPRLRVLVGPMSDVAGCWVEAAARRIGACPSSASPPMADVETLAAAIAAPGADLVLVIGGGGLGQRDHGADVLRMAGSLLAHGVALAPGHAVALGHAGTTPVIVTGHDLAGVVAPFLALVLPLIETLSGVAEPPSIVEGALTRKVASLLGFDELVLARRDGGAIEPIVTGDVTLSALLAADGWFFVGADSEGHAAGEKIRVRAL